MTLNNCSVPIVNYCESCKEVFTLYVNDFHLESFLWKGKYFLVNGTYYLKIKECQVCKYDRAEKENNINNYKEVKSK